MNKPIELSDELHFRCGVTSKNRMALAALTNQQSGDDGFLSEDEARWLERRAQGGFGIITTCAAYVSADGKGFDGQLGVASEEQGGRTESLARAISAAGALGLVQLYHGGVRSPARLTGVQPKSASAFSSTEENFEPPRALTSTEIPAVQQDFVEAAKRVVAHGFSGVELHAAHGYLLSQFLSSTMNTRADGYGGSAAARYRFVGEIVRATRSAIPKAVLGVRISPEDFGYARGLDLHDSLEVASRLAEDGADYVHISLWDIKRLTKKEPTRHPIPMFRAALPPEVPLIVAGAIGTRETAEMALGLGADMVAIGRAAIINPDWAKNVLTAGWVPDQPPLTPEQYLERAVSPTFINYLRRFKGMVG